MMSLSHSNWAVSRTCFWFLGVECPTSGSGLLALRKSTHFAPYSSYCDKLKKLTHFPGPTSPKLLWLSGISWDIATKVFKEVQIFTCSPDGSYSLQEEITSCIRMSKKHPSVNSDLISRLKKSTKATKNLKFNFCRLYLFVRYVIRNFRGLDLLKLQRNYRQKECLAFMSDNQGSREEDTLQPTLRRRSLVIGRSNLK